MIELVGIRKSFRRNARGARWWRRLTGSAPTTTAVALHDLCLTVQEGSFYSLLGPNGAGKTTTMKIVSTLLLPDAGVARVAGFDVVRDAREVRRAIGVSLRGERTIYWKLTGRQNLELFASLAGYRGRRSARRIDDVIDLIGLRERIDDFVERYSMGMKQRLAIGTALVHQPRVLLLDEPTIGLDPASARSLRAFIRDDLCRAQGVTVLYTTHYMHEADELSDRIGIISRGRLVADDTPSRIRARLTGRPILEFQIQALPPGLIPQLHAHPQVTDVSAREDPDGRLVLRLQTRSERASLAEFAVLLADAGVEPTSIQFVQPTLEDAFLALTGEQGPSESGALSAVAS